MKSIHPYRIKATRLDKDGNLLPRGPHYLSFEIATGVWVLTRTPNGNWRAKLYRDLTPVAVTMYSEQDDS